ncbi:MAG: glucose 1-dehydrogenase [Planctomycetes bacterium]|nr:glucose 1-dehydrogenase [Planctomycetota bacterium]MCB9935678.1 glucose 1-dehydrogenase [Planctomycetota bacterium]
MNRLKDKVALVTGASMGIGRATALLMAREGAAVAVTDLADDAGREVVQEIITRDGRARFWHLDVSDEAQVQRVFSEVENEFGPITVLVNNAGIAGPDKPTHELSIEEWEQVQAVNVKGVFLCTKHVIPQMKRAGHGSIINMSSIYGLVGAPDVPPYHASKGAVRLMTKTDALLYAANLIRVNSIHPGYIWTPMVEQHLKNMPDPVAAREAAAAAHPLGHMGEPDDIGWACVYLASDEARFVTGSELVVDGGYTCR